MRTFFRREAAQGPGKSLAKWDDIVPEVGVAQLTSAILLAESCRRHKSVNKDCVKRTCGIKHTVLIYLDTYQRNKLERKTENGKAKQRNEKDQLLDDLGIISNEFLALQQPVSPSKYKEAQENAGSVCRPDLLDICG